MIVDNLTHVTAERFTTITQQLCGHSPDGSTTRSCRDAVVDITST